MIRDLKLEKFRERCERQDQPITAEVFLTDYCNLSCQYCRYSNKSGKFMRYEDFVLYAKRLVEMGVRGIILTGGGEPTINPNFAKITSWLERNEIPFGINTNLVIGPVFANANYIKVSMDTGTDERYKEIRGKDYMQRVLANLRDTIEYKKRAGNGTRIGVQCVATNKQDVISFYNATKGYDVDYIYIRPLETTGAAKTGEADVKEWLSNISDDRLNVSYKFGYIGYQSPWCVANWAVITVDVDGNIPYCCHRPTETVGNILDLNIMMKKKAHHVDMRTCEKPCRLSAANKYLADGKWDEEDVFI